MSLQPEISHFVVACGGEDSGPVWESKSPWGRKPTPLTDCRPHVIFWLNWDSEIHFPVILKIIIMHSLQKVKWHPFLYPRLYFCLLTCKIEKYEVKEVAAWKWHLLWVINTPEWPLSEYQIKEDSKDIDSMGIIISFLENTFSIK